MSSHNVKNSTDTPLGAGDSFTGLSQDISSYASISVTVITDQVGTLTMEQSTDGSNWDDVTTVSVLASTQLDKVIYPTSRYYRTTFTNDAGGAQTYLRLQTIFSKDRDFPTLTEDNFTDDSVKTNVTNVVTTQPDDTDAAAFGGVLVSQSTSVNRFKMTGGYVNSLLYTTITAGS